MAKFVNLIPGLGQTDVPRTAVVCFTILTDGYSGAQISSLAATIDGYQAILGGAFVSGNSGTIFPSTGKYVVGVYPKSPNFLRSAAQIDVHLEVLDDYSSLDAYNYSFFTTGYAALPAPGIPSIDGYVTARACDLSKPFFPQTDLGLVAALDSGVGTEVDLQWKQGHPFNENNIVFYNLYFSTSRVNVFEGNPLFLVSDTSATVGGLPPGDMHFFGVKVTEFSPSDVTTSGLKMAGPNMFFYPSTFASGQVEDTDTVILAQSVDGFPDFGIIHLGTELVKYTAIQVSPPGFVTTNSLRGYIGTQAEIHSNGIEIKLYHGKEDDNTIITQAVPTFQKPNDAVTWVRVDGYGNDGYRDGYDGYDAYYNNLPGANARFDGYDGYFITRQETFDSLTTDGKNNDASGTFNRLDYCGTYRKRSPASFMQGQCTGTYFGGVQVDGSGNRVRVPDARTHMLQREELLLESTGEPFALIRRMWTGQRCFCMMNRREHADARCPQCFGTGFVQGYIQFFNPRRPDKRILVRVDPAVDDLIIVDRGGLEPQYEPDAWTLPFPAVKDRDILVRFNPDNTEEFRYEILNVTRVRAMFVQSGAQKFKIKRLPKTSIIYQFPAVRDARPFGSVFITSANNGPGINLHSHEFIVPDTANLGTIKFATLESEGHNHLVLNGVVQLVLGHTHTLP